MSRKLGWLVFLVAAVLYSLLIYYWWQEGNLNFERQRQQQINESAIFRH